MRQKTLLFTTGFFFVLSIVFGVLYFTSRASDTNEQKMYPLLAKRLFLENRSDILINFQPLRKEIEEYLDRTGVKHSFYFEYLFTGSTIRYGEDTKLVGASLMKIPVVMDLYKSSEQGKIELDQQVTVRADDISKDPEFGNQESLKAGDVITIASVYAVNPQTRQSTGELAQFVVTADTNSSGGAIASLPISPAIVLSGQYQNVNRAPTDEDAVNLFGAATTYAGVVAPQNLVYHKSAFAFGSADFELPSEGCKASRAVDKDSGLSLTMTSQFDISNYRTIHRLDFLGGWKCVYPELACRVVGQPA